MWVCNERLPFLLFMLTSKMFFHDAASTSKPSSNAKNTQDRPANITDVGKMVDDLLDTTSSLLLEEVRRLLCFFLFSTSAELLC